MTLTTLIQTYPRISVILIAIIVSLLSMLATKFFSNQARIKELNEKNKTNQALLKEHKDNPQKMMEIQKEMMSSSLERMRHSWKPLLITLVPFILIFNFMRDTLTTTIIASSWFWYYLITAIIFSGIWKKVLKVH